MASGVFLYALFQDLFIFLVPAFDLAYTSAGVFIDGNIISLDCQPGDILEYVEGEAEEDDDGE